jgi:hypothetical protein
MRLIALSIVILAGAVMASAGVIADALPAMRQYNSLEICGLALVAIASLLFIVEWWPVPSSVKSAGVPLASKARAA